MNHLKKEIRKFILFILIITLFLGIAVTSYGITPAEEEKYLRDNKERTFILGVDPCSGMEYFKYDSKEAGYIIPLMDYISKDLGIKIKVEARSWSEIYPDLINGKIDILFAANQTEERKKFMSFTKPVYKNPYAIITKNGSGIQTIGDIDHKRVGFLKEDYIIDRLPKLYDKINYQKFVFDDTQEGIEAVNKGTIDAFITVGGAIVYDYIYAYPELNYVFKINKINSELTLSTRKENEILACLLNREIASIKDTKLKEIIKESEIKYYRKIMKLNDAELNYLKKDGQAVVGITKDYLPFDYYSNGQYLGISGEIIKEIGNKTGIQFTYVYDDFDALYKKLKRGEIDILNVAKTEERLKYIIFPRPFSNERDIIVGRKDSLDVRDIFGLENKKVAVISEFWHKESLEKNLVNVNIIETKNIIESLKLVNDGKADYLIENPTVVRYYIDELELYDLCEKGVTTSGSYLYYGINKDKENLASIIDKVIPLLDMGELTKKGYGEIPHKESKVQEKRLIFIISGLGILLFFLVLLMFKTKKDLIEEKMKIEALNAREELLYTDTLTNLKNRNHYITKVKNKIDEQPYPQTLIIADMNNLKIVNDKYGHQLGDELLKMFSKSLHEICPKNSYLYRFGGDEFYILLFETDINYAEHLINRVREYLDINGVMIGEDTIIRASVAFGYSYRENNLKSMEEMGKEADFHMYRNKIKMKEA